jgi:hypothetical protein
MEIVAKCMLILFKYNFIPFLNLGFDQKIL